MNISQCLNLLVRSFVIMILVYSSCVTAKGSEKVDILLDYEDQEITSHELVEAQCVLLSIVKLLQDNFKKHGNYPYRINSFLENQKKHEMTCFYSIQFIDGEPHNNFGDVIEYVQTSESEVLLYARLRDFKGDLTNNIEGFRLVGGKMFDYENKITDE